MRWDAYSCSIVGDGNLCTTYDKVLQGEVKEEILGGEWVLSIIDFIMFFQYVSWLD